MRKAQTIALTGATGAFGAALKTRLEKLGMNVLPLKYGVDWNYSNYLLCQSYFRRADLLVLAHGSKEHDAMQANCNSFIAFVERFRAEKALQGQTPEVWAVGSEIECHPSFGNKRLELYSSSKRAFARYASLLYSDPTITYRHIVPSAFSSKMGPGLMTAEFAASVTLLMIRLGFRYVPVTYTGVAFINFFRFRRLARRLIPNAGK